MPTSTTTIVDDRGRVMFRCDRCCGAMSLDDLFELGLRIPERGESADEYRDAELIDRLDHVGCARAMTAG
jgi:hypothetical protein